jgi:ribosomal protein L37AE/L43A
MASEKDRLGDKLHDAEKAREDEYFARRDRELLNKLKREKEQQFKDELHAAKEMTCPRCGKTLHERIEHGVSIDECPGCGGVWLDKGELDALVKADEQGWFGRLFGGSKK